MSETRTYWLSFTDPERPTGDQFLGAAVIDVYEADQAEALPVLQAIRARAGLPPAEVEIVWLSAAIKKSHTLKCNPGGEVMTLRIDDLPSFQRNGAKYPRGVLLSRADVEALDGDAGRTVH